MMRLDAMATALTAAGESCQVRGDGSVEAAAISTDTRGLGPGALYLALKGERFDGHDFAGAALAAGAVALLVERPLPLPLPQLLVPDAHRALGALAAHWRARFALPVIAVTGSNGKTTTTQMIAAVLERAFGAAPQGPAWHATRGNQNNAIGVPLTLLGLRPWQRAAVVELGMNHRGEIAPLSAWTRPTVAVVTNAQREHQEFLESVEATARENGAVISALSPQGRAVFPADDACAGIWRALAADRAVEDFTLGTGSAALHGRVLAHAANAAESTRLALATSAGEWEVELASAGEHNARNALAAAAACLAIGIAPADVVAGLAAFRPVAGRGTCWALAGGVTLIDDSYNANPDSVRAAIDMLAARPGPRVLVFGDMGEVGARGAEFHREIGAYARTRGIELLFALGPQALAAAQAYGEDARHCASIDELLAALRALLAQDPAGARPRTLLVKGSRFMRLERVVRALAAEAEPEHA